MELYVRLLGDAVVEHVLVPRRGYVAGKKKEEEEERKGEQLLGTTTHTITIFEMDNSQRTQFDLFLVLMIFYFIFLRETVEKVGIYTKGNVFSAVCIFSGSPDLSLLAVCR